jgi:hypothetical protein
MIPSFFIGIPFSSFATQLGIIIVQRWVELRLSLKLGELKL